MFGYFEKVFGPILGETTEIHVISKPVNWKLIDEMLTGTLSPVGNMLPSKKIAKPVGKVTDKGATFTMNYLNMMPFLPSVTLQQKSDHEITATYFYKSPYSWAQMYWMGFCTFIFGFAALFLFVTTFLSFTGKYSLSETLIGFLISAGIAGVGYLFLAFALHFRRDLLNKSKEKTLELIEAIQINE